jgi:hypothetical protein
MPDILTILSSGIFSVLFTGILNSWNNDQNYKRDYYKKIVEKRFGAYESVENTLKYLNFTLYDKNSKGVYFAIFSEITVWTDFNKSLTEAQLQSRWLSSNTQKSIHDLSVTISEIGENTPLPINVDNLESAASPYLTQIIEIKRMLDASSLKDFQDLHDVDTFFKATRRLKFLKWLRG